MGDRLQAGKLSRYVTSHSGQLSLAIPPWIGAMSTGLGWGGNLAMRHRQYWFTGSTAYERKIAPRLCSFEVWPSCTFTFSGAWSVSRDALFKFVPRLISGTDEVGPFKMWYLGGQWQIKY